MKIEAGSLIIDFGTGVFPVGIAIGGYQFFSASPVLEIELGDGRKLRPLEGPALDYKAGDARIIEFESLTMTDGSGCVEPNMFLSLRHEIHPDGHIFCNAFFLAESCQAPDIRSFELKYNLALRQFEPVRWALNYRPRKTDATLIQTSAPERGLEAGTDRVLETGIWPLAGFNCFSPDGPSFYVEFFMEGDNVLSGKNPDDNCSAIRWNNGNAELSWNFQKTRRSCDGSPWQWRNSWGCIITAAPATRHLPPLPMFHYFDNLKRYPTDEAIKAMAAAGAELLILHENWRFDPQDGGVPYDGKRFREVIAKAHEYGLRVAPYIRGNEDSVIGYNCEWFDKYFQRDFDGLYMDYGGPFHGMTPPDESYQSGRIRFRDHYLRLKKLRKRVGDDGILYSHTGPLFSAIGLTGGNVDGYVSGEGERGLLIRSRLDHAYYAMTAACCGTMWTAAFPEYSSPAMVPFLAATGQTPHLNLGTQFESSSLVHPPAPGLEDRVFRPLWKLWRLFRAERDMRIVNDYNSSGVFAADPEISHYLMISADRRKALLILGNFSPLEREVSPQIDWSKCPFDPSGAQAWKLAEKADIYDNRQLKIAGHGVAGLLFTHDEIDFSDYNRPEPQPCDECREYEAELTRQKELRENPSATRYLRVTVPEMCVAYEKSMIDDLYDNRFELCRELNGRLEHIGWIAKNGFQSEPPTRQELVQPGRESAWIDLREILPPGNHSLAVRSLHLGDLYYVNTPFYSFITIQLTNNQGEAEHEIVFRNELEADRSLLHLSVHL